jgi:hypothetical protein
MSYRQSLPPGIRTLNYENDFMQRGRMTTEFRLLGLCTRAAVCLGGEFCLMEGILLGCITEGNSNKTGKVCIT